MAVPLRVCLAACVAGVLAQKDGPGVPVGGIGPQMSAIYVHHVDSAGAGVAVRGDVLLVPTEYGGLQLFDVSDKAAPVAMGDIDMPVVKGLGFTGAQDFAVVTLAGGAGLNVVDFRQVDYAGQWPEMRGLLRGAWGAMRVHGGHVYVAAGEGELLVMGLADPAAPQELGRVTLGGVGKLDVGVTVVEVSASGRYVYTVGGGLLMVVDVSDKTAPVVVGQMALSGHALKVSPSGTHVFVVTSGDRDGAGRALVVVDVSVPGQLAEVGRLAVDESELFQGMDVAGQYVYIATWVGLLQVDVTDPTRPQRAGAQGGIPRAQSVTVSGGYAYVGQWQGVHIIDIRAFAPAETPVPAPLVPDAAPTPGPLPPSPSATVGRQRVSNFFEAVQKPRIAVGGSGAQAKALVTRSSDGLAVFGVGDVTNPVSLDDLPPVDHRRPVRVAVTGDARHALVIGDYGGVFVYDIGAPVAALVVYTREPNLNYNAVHVAGQYAYLVSYDGKVQVLDIAGLGVRAPTAAGFLNAGLGLIDEAAASTDVMYLWSRYEGKVHVVDVADKQAPRLAGSVSGLVKYVSSGRMAASGSVALLMTLDKVTVIDASNKDAPFVTATVQKDFAAFTGAAIVGQRAYIADLYARLHVLDISTPAAPTTVRVFPTQLRPADVFVRDGHAFLTDGNHIEIVDLNAPLPSTTAAPTAAPTTPAPATAAPPTDAPATNAPDTNAPPTPAPATDAPATNAPDTDSPLTPAPATPAPDTEAPAPVAPPPSMPLPSVQLLKGMRAALAASGALPSWDGDDACATWQGVTCHSDGEVKSLYLQDAPLQGVVPDLSSLTRLDSLSLRGTGITGFAGLPLQSLREIDFSFTAINGPVPDIVAQMDNVMTLRARGAGLQGTLPVFPASMRMIDVSDNALTGSIPTPLPAGLLNFIARNNKLTGTLPPSDTALRVIVNNNQLEGGLIPYPSLVVGLFHFNALVGGFDPTLMPRAEYIDVSHNGLGGSLPSLAETSLLIFQGHHNQFSGSFPFATPGQRQLDQLIVNDNLLSGQEPTAEQAAAVAKIYNIARNGWMNMA